MLRENGIKPSLLLHSCCGPCSSYVIEYLHGSFNITVFYYNPNIYPESEYLRRLEEQKKLLSHFDDVKILEGEYEPNSYFAYIQGHENEPEGGKRCYLCYEQRLEQTAKTAKENCFDYFGTVISVSPYKNALWLAEIGTRLSKKYDIKFLIADFKKRGGYQRSIELSKEYDLYRQNYCGCKFSVTDRMKDGQI